MKRLLFLTLVTASAIALQATGQAASSNLVGILDTYVQGRYDEAVRQAAAVEDLGPLRVRFVQDVPMWINSDAGLADQRRAAAASFLLELTHARLESDWGRLVDLIEWMCVELRTKGPATAFERAWHLASIALASRARARLWLLGEYPQLPHQPPRRRPPPKNDNPSPKHLLHALERFPDDPQLRLAQIVAWTWGRDDEPARNTRIREEGPRVVMRPPAQLEAITALAVLTQDPVVGAEALLRIGLVHFSVGDHTAALDAYQTAQQRGADATTRYLAFFCAGRALEALQRHAEAAGQYAKALDVIPSAESAIVALASLRFAGDQRESAIALVGQRFATNARDDDPGRLLGYGSFIRWAELQSAMRLELRR